MRLKRRVLALALLMTASACADVTLAPDEAATIEFINLLAPAAALGDTLRDVDGVPAPVRAIVRNQQGDVLTDAVVRYTYADAARDSALFVDSLRGFVVSVRPLTGSGTTARIAARVGGSLQVLRTVLVTVRPDSADRAGAAAIDTLRATLPDTGTAGATANTSRAVSVTVRHVDSLVTPVPNWLVKYELVQPANPGNDSTKSVFLVNDVRGVSDLDTTDAAGVASRFVRVRTSQLPAETVLDSAVVRVSVTYRGRPVRGAPFRIVVPITRRP